MKKILVVFAIILLLLINYKDKDIIIPHEAIRFRIIANSNSAADQLIKSQLELAFEDYLYELIKDNHSSDEVKATLINNIDNLNQYVHNYLVKAKASPKFKISIGKNYFPPKVYHDVKYSAGYYDSIVLTLGRGDGLNWWCVMYPPLCKIDHQDTTDIEYTTLVQELIGKYHV